MYFPVINQRLDIRPTTQVFGEITDILHKMQLSN